MQIILDTKDIRLDRRRNMFFVEAPDGKSRGISPHKVSSIAVTHDCWLSAAAIQLAALHEVPIYFLGRTGKVIARLASPYFSSIATLRRQQVLFSMSEDASSWMVGIYLLKLEYQVKNLRRLPSGAAYAERLQQQAGRFQKCAGKTMLQARTELLSAEAVTAKMYWQGLAELLPDYVDFDKRSRRPAQDNFNAALNYLYGMLYSVVEQGLFAAGLDPHLGIFHADEYNKPVLAFDFIEPFRPWIDQLLIEQYLERKVMAGFFQYRKGYGVLLNKEGKSFFIPLFNQWLQSESIWGGRKSSARNHIYQLAGRFASKLRADSRREEETMETAEKEAEEGYPDTEDFETQD